MKCACYQNNAAHAQVIYTKHNFDQELPFWPLFASFPVRQALWEKLAAQSIPAALWFGLASLGLWMAALRSLAVLTMAPEHTPWLSVETWSQRVLIGIGLVSLLILGLIPQWAQPLLANLPLMFEHLGK